MAEQGFLYEIVGVPKDSLKSIGMDRNSKQRRYGSRLQRRVPPGHLHHPVIKLSGAVDFRDSVPRATTVRISRETFGTY